MYDLNMKKISADYVFLDDMHSGLVLVRDDQNHYGYVDRTGKVVVPVQYDLAYGFSDTGKAVVGLDGIFSVIDKSGNKLLDLPDGVRAIYEVEGDYIVFCGSDWKYGIMDTNGQVILEAKYDYISSIRESPSLFYVRDENGKAYIFDAGSSTTFNDTNEAWMKAPVKFVNNRGLMKGTAPGVFDPNATVNLGTALTVTARICGLDTSPLSGEDWTKPGMDWGHRMGMTTATDPNATVERQEMVYMLWVASGAYEVYSDASYFSDYSLVKDEYKDAVAWAAYRGILQGSNNKIEPNGSLTRAELAALIQRAVVNGVI